MAHVCDMLHSYVWRIAFVCVTWPINMCDMTHSYVWYEAFIPATWRIRKCDMTHLYVRHRYVCHDSFLCVTWLIDMCDMIHWYVLIFAIHCQAVRVHYDSFTCATHCQAVRVYYDPVKVTYLDLLEVFFANVDVTQLNQQGLYEGTQVLATHCNSLQHTVSHCITLEHTARHCYTLQCTATHTTTLHHTGHLLSWRWSGLFCRIRNRIRNIYAHDAHFTKEPNGQDKYLWDTAIQYLGKSPCHMLLILTNNRKIIAAKEAAYQIDKPLLHISRAWCTFHKRAQWAR